MRKHTAVGFARGGVAVALAIVMLSGCQVYLCGCVSKTQYRRITAQRDMLNNQYQHLQNELAKTRAELEHRQLDLDTLQNEDATVALVVRLRENIAVLQTQLQSLRGELASKEDAIQWHRSHYESVTEELWLKTAEADKLRSDARVCQEHLAQVVKATETPTVIESQIDGDFEGWEGETIFKLTNGQIWEQILYDYTYHYAFMPEVLIYETSGGYKMRVEGVDEAIYVRRIK